METGVFPTGVGPQGNVPVGEMVALRRFAAGPAALLDHRHPARRQDGDRPQRQLHRPQALVANGVHDLHRRAVFQQGDRHALAQAGGAFQRAEQAYAAIDILGLQLAIIGDAGAREIFRRVPETVPAMQVVGAKRRFPAGLRQLAQQIGL